MTYKKLIGFGILVAGVLVVVKTIFYGSFVWDGSTTLHLAYWLLTAALAAAFVRRLGVITMLEAVVVLILWLLFEIIGDAAIVGPLAGFRVLIDPNFAIGYLVLALSIIFFHKKRHVHRRQELESK